MVIISNHDVILSPSPAPNLSQEGGKTKRAFQMAIQMFNKVDPKYKRGHVEMIYQAANLMKEYDLEKDLDAYRMVFDLFPKVF